MAYYCPVIPIFNDSIKILNCIYLGLTILDFDTNKNNENGIFLNRQHKEYTLNMVVKEKL